ncbi:unnamed protein product [Mytilus coruscus]|uniref:Uncharacterized protein n=1 Tax=Mytilus coruscus TaxID=42192 RepID=A0A6J8CJ84_MYTCO|nr:unnamed protein product [Mytilus coruscus]
MKNNRVQRDYVSVQMSDGEISDMTVLDEKPSVMRNSVYRLTRTYWTSKNTKGFRRRLYELHESAEKPTRFVSLQYVVEGDVPIFPNVHGNTKTGNVRTKSSRNKHITAFLKAPIKPSQFMSSIQVSVREQAGTSGTSLEPQPQHKRLSISLEETHLDPTIHELIWKKAESLVDSGLVNKAPGVQNGFMVASTSGKDPHFVRF